MALGIVLPALGVGLIVMIMYALLADLNLISAFLIFLGSGLTSLLGISVLVAVRRPMRPVDFDGTSPQTPLLHGKRSPARGNGASTEAGSLVSGNRLKGAPG